MYIYLKKCRDMLYTYVYQSVSERYLILSSESCLGVNLSVQFIVLQFQRLIMSHSCSFSAPLSQKHTHWRARGGRYPEVRRLKPRPSRTLGVNVDHYPERSRKEEERDWLVRMWGNGGCIRRWETYFVAGRVLYLSRDRTLTFLVSELYEHTIPIH